MARRAVVVLCGRAAYPSIVYTGTSRARDFIARIATAGHRSAVTVVFDIHS